MRLGHKTLRHVICVLLVLFAGVSAAAAGERNAMGPSHPSLYDAELPPLIPVETFFSTARESWDHRVSPDGTKLLWIAQKDGRPTVHFRALSGTEVKTIASERAVRWAYWANDSRHITAWRDRDGDENYHLLLADTENPHAAPRDVTPHAGATIRFQQKFHDRPLDVLILDNRRDASVFDLYLLNMATGEETLVAQNPGDVRQYYTDQSGKVIAVKRRLPDTGWSLDVPDGRNWRSIARGTLEDKLWIEGYPPAGATWAWAISNRGRDRQAMVRLDLATGQETLVYQDEHADIQGLLTDDGTYKPLMAWSVPDHPRTKVFDPKIKAAFDRLAKDGPFDVRFTAWSRDKSLITLSLNRDTQGVSSILIDQRSGKITTLASPEISRHSAQLAPMRPVRFTARDGLELNGYLTVPRGIEARKLPMVLRVHGGPFSRDFWGYVADDQLLANRGYAVLRVNYRGSTGYGRAFMKAAKKQFARKMHDDLIDAVRWAVDEEIADPDKVAIYGHSYGGYATLIGLTFTPDVFAAGIDVVGVSDLVTAFKTFPSYWKNGLARWHAYVGRLGNAEDVADMHARSPINYVDRISKPLLVVHGANDVRVIRAHSDKIVAAAERNGVDVEYIVFEDEGHAIRRWRNKATFARAMEQFLAKHLGGRAEIPDLRKAEALEAERPSP